MNSKNKLKLSLLNFPNSWRQINFIESAKTIDRCYCDKLNFIPSLWKISNILTEFSTDRIFIAQKSYYRKYKLTSLSKWQRAPHPLYDIVFKFASPVRLVEVSSKSGVPIDLTCTGIRISCRTSGLNVKLDGNHRSNGMTQHQRFPE